MIVAGVFGGTFFGSFLGPILLDEFRSFRRRVVWVNPRLKLIRELFDEVEAPVVSLSDVAIRCGCTLEEARDLLVEAGGRGTTMSNGQEGWCLDTTRWQFSAHNIDRARS